MKLLTGLQQGSDQWLAVRMQYHPSGEAAAMMGLDPKTPRNELLRIRATGDKKVFSDWVRVNLLERGHEIEAAARPLLEADIADDLYPIVGTDDSGYLLASFDGVTMDGSIGCEFKSWNEKLAAAVRAGDLPDSHWPQVEQQIIVGGLDHVIFVVTDGTRDRWVQLEYHSRPERAKQLWAAWKQFDDDVKNYQHVESAPAAVAAPVMALPALSIQVNGSISLIDNLPLFGAKLKAFIDAIEKKPDNDQDFANLEAAVKTLKTAEDALEAAEASALAQTASIDEMRRTVAMYKELARSNRLLFDKIVKAEKDNIRSRIMAEGVDAFKAHVLGLNARLGKQYMPIVPVDFASAMKGKKTIASLRGAVSDELARGKIAANEIADRIQINLTLLRDTAYPFLFADAAQIVLKANDDFAALVKSRIDAHKAAEQAKAEQLRESIRAEEAAKLEAKMKSEAEAEQARQESLRRIEAQRIADAAKPAPIESAQASPSVAPAAYAGPVADKSYDGMTQHIMGTTDPRNLPPPIPAPWGTEAKRPSDHDLIQCIADHWHVHPATALEWIISMDIPSLKRA